MDKMSQSVENEMIPRDYQLELMKIALKKNTIVFLPTGSGKTYIALLVLKTMSKSLLKPYSKDGKVTFILVNTVALVDQHAKYIKDHTTLRVGCYSGDMQLDFWPRTKWYEEFDKYQVFIMTIQILLNLVNQNFLDLNKVNLIIFDECHRGVNDQPMRQLMKSQFQNLEQPPRVLGLTATLLNGNCKPHRVMDEVESLETTYHSKVATVDGLERVVGFSTNPKEKFKLCEMPCPSSTQQLVMQYLSSLVNLIASVKNEPAPMTLKSTVLKPLDEEEGLKKLANMVKDTIFHIEILGIYGGLIAVLSHSIQVNRLKRHCQDIVLSKILQGIQTSFSNAQQLLERAMEGYDAKERIYRFSSDKVLKLIEIFEEYPLLSDEELCALIFTQRRFTAKVIYHILVRLSECVENFSHIKPNFMVGMNSNPYNNTCENLFTNKKNKQALQSFANKEINVLVASNVLEEGVDIPKCTLVVKFDKPEDYRSYIQSKGRARHPLSLYYIIVESGNMEKYVEKYHEFQLVEEILNKYLIGKNIDRPDPNPESIQAMYYEDAMPPYYVDGPNSAQVNMLSAIPLLSQYCNSLPSDKYTSYSPELYYEEKTELTKLVRVTIVLPTVCPILEPIKGLFMPNLKLAKRSAALEACKRLHQCGELDNNLLPRKREVAEEDISFLFKHYPSVKEPKAGEGKNKRMHEKQVAKCLKGQIKPLTEAYLHIIQLSPCFARKDEDIGSSTVYDAYVTPLTFGILTPHRLPPLCDFPIYVTLGTIIVSIKVNVQEVSLTEEQIKDAREFHLLVLDDIIAATKEFLIFDNSDSAEMLLLVPVDKTNNNIDFDVLKKYKTINSILELTTDEKLKLEVDQEGYLRKIVAPWYRQSGHYIVTEVSLNKNALSLFPNNDFGTFLDYYRNKHNLSILNPQQPLLLVKGLSKQLIYIKPKGLVHNKRKRDKTYDEFDEHLLPELVVKQEFPSPLWIQASFLPTILSRVSYLCQLEELRSKIARQAGLGLEVVNETKPLDLDEYLLDYEPDVHKPEEVNVLMSNTENSKMLALPSTSLMKNCNKDFVSKMLEAEYPWKDVDEPKDIERYLDVTVMDIEYYELFVGRKLTGSEAEMKNKLPKTSQLALTYDKDFVEKPIKLLEQNSKNEGPDLRDLYRAMTTAKANDIVNLERLETLGDSYLKLITSVYIAMRFPSYDEGLATNLKGRLVSNKNLYYLAAKKKFGGIMKFSELSIKEWLPPCLKIPDVAARRLKNDEIALSCLYHMSFPKKQQVAGELSEDMIAAIEMEDLKPEESEKGMFRDLAPFFKGQFIGDKQVADVVEGLLGAYFQSCGFTGGLKFVEWMGIIPPTENLEQLLNRPPPDPRLDKNSSMKDINFYLPNWKEVEQILGYHFQNRSYLLQALTHSSFTPNRITRSYETLEFIGDAILDFLITCHIFESCGNLDPGQLTDLRSALVNNNTFASLVVRCNLHKFMLMINMQLQRHIDKFVDYLASKKYQIDDEVLILIEEDEFSLAEYVDVPKVLGDIFEALAGAVYLDSGKNLNTVWKVIYKIMWREIDLFSANVPKNVIRRLFEWTPDLYPKFGNSVDVRNGKTMVPLEFMIDGNQKRVHGFGTNKNTAKKAAAKLALRSIEK